MELGMIWYLYLDYIRVLRMHYVLEVHIIYKVNLSHATCPHVGSMGLGGTKIMPTSKS